MSTYHTVLCFLYAVLYVYSFLSVLYVSLLSDMTQYHILCYHIIYFEHPPQLFFFVGGIAALTLIINATTAQKVLEYLGLLKETDDDKLLVLDQIRKSLRKRVFQQVEKLRHNLHISSADKIIKYNSLLREDSSLWELRGRTSRLSRDSSVDVEAPGVSNRSLSRRDSGTEVMPDLLSYVRTVFLSIVRVEYWHRIEDGSLPRQVSLFFAMSCIRDHF